MITIGFLVRFRVGLGLGLGKAFGPGRMNLRIRLVWEIDWGCGVIITGACVL